MIFQSRPSLHFCKISPTPTPLMSTCDPYMEEGRGAVFRPEVAGDVGGSGDMISERESGRTIHKNDTIQKGSYTTYTRTPTHHIHHTCIYGATSWLQKVHVDPYTYIYIRQNILLLHTTVTVHHESCTIYSYMHITLSILSLPVSCLALNTQYMCSSVDRVPA